MASKLQPPPINKGTVVYDELLAFVDVHVHDPLVKALITQLLKERYTFGMEKYGQPLRTKDGRIGIRDALEEAGDLMMYLMKCRCNNQDITPFLKFIPLIQNLCEPPPKIEKARK